MLNPAPAQPLPDGVLYRPRSQPLVETGIRVRVSDTVGAGDRFNGTLAAALARGEALPDAMRWANAAAAVSVMGHGAIGGMPTREQVRERLTP